MEKVALWIVLGVAIAGLVYAGMLVGQVVGADQGTEKMRTVANAIRQGANAYLWRQFKAIILLMFLLTAIIYFATTAEAGTQVKLGRAMAFLMGRHVLVADRVRRHEPGGRAATCAWPPPPAPATATPCSSATAPARSPAC